MMSSCLFLFPLEPSFHVVVTLRNQYARDQLDLFIDGHDLRLNSGRPLPSDLVYHAHFTERQLYVRYYERKHSCRVSFPESACRHSKGNRMVSSFLIVSHTRVNCTQLCRTPTCSSISSLEENICSSLHPEHVMCSVRSLCRAVTFGCRVRGSNC